MKKVVKAGQAASVNSSPESIRNIPAQTSSSMHPGVELLLSEALRADYELRQVPGTLFDFTLTSEKDVEFMPKVAVSTEYDEVDDLVYMSVSLEFPTLSSNEHDYADTIHYYIDQWSKVGELVTYMHKHPFSPHYNDYAEYEELDY